MSAAPAIDLNEGLVAHYTFDGHLEDSSANSHDGTANGKLAYVKGASGQALQLNGTDGYVKLDKFTEDFSAGITISVWASFDQGSGSWARIVDLGNGAGSDNILLARDGYSSTLCFEVYSPSSTRNTYTQKVEVRSGIKYGELNHILVRAKPDGGSYKTEFYINGIKQQTVDGYGNASDGTNLPRAITRSNATIAKSNWSSDGLFKGVQDELRIYNRYLSDQEVQAVRDVSAPVTKYHFDPINGTTPKGRAYIKGFTVSLQGADDLSGIRSLQYRINSGAWTEYTKPFEIYAANALKLEYYSTDRAGNTETSMNVMDFAQGTFTGAGSY
nr:LamG domain-containing protein [Paenibacillus phyllosphaerae]